VRARFIVYFTIVRLRPRADFGELFFHPNLVYRLTSGITRFLISRDAGLAGDGRNNSLQFLADSTIALAGYSGRRYLIRDTAPDLRDDDNRG
jgi:hypothetical protein